MPNGLQGEGAEFLVNMQTARDQSILSLLFDGASHGLAAAALPAGGWDAPYTASEGVLPQGFSDSNEDTLSVANLSANRGTVSGNGTFTVRPEAG